MVKEGPFIASEKGGTLTKARLTGPSRPFFSLLKLFASERISLLKLFEIGFLAILKAFFAPKTRISLLKLF